MSNPRTLILLVIALVTALAAALTARYLLTSVQPPAGTPAAPVVDTQPVVVAAGVAQVTIPSYLGDIHERHPVGTSTPLVFVIGEDHVNLDVQRAVADLIGFLRSAYDVRMVLTEGYDKTLQSPLNGLPLEDQHTLARVELDARRISAIDYVALYYPDLQVIGVEDMVAYAAHGASLVSTGKKVQQRAEALNNELTDFLFNDISQQEGTQEQEDRLRASLKRFQADSDIDALAATIYEIVGATSPTGLKLRDIVRRVAELEGESEKEVTNTSAGVTRDELMVANVRKVLTEGQHNAVLVVGSTHLNGIGKGLSDTGIPYVSIRPAGIDKNLKSSGTDEDLNVYNDWKSGKAYGLEAAFGHIKTQPALARPTYQDDLKVTGALLAIDRRFTFDGDGVRAKEGIDRFNLPEGLRFEDVRGIPAGTQIRFSYQGKVYDARFGINAGVVRDGDNQPIAAKKAGGRFYAIYDRGRSPPGLPPKPPGGGGGGPPDDPFGPRGHLAAIFPQDSDKYRNAMLAKDKQNPGMVILVIPERDHRLARIVDDKVVVLGGDPDEIKRLADRFRAANTGPEKFDLAVRLGERLLEGIDDQLPPGTTGVTVLVEGDWLGDLSLPGLARLSGMKSASRFSELANVAVAPFTSLQKGELAGVVSWTPPGVEIERTAVLVDDRVLANKEFAASLSAIEHSGVVVNKVDSHTRDLFIIGAIGGGNWRVTLTDGRVVTPNSEAAQRALHGVEQVVAFNAEGMDAITVTRRFTIRQTRDEEAALAEVQADVKAVAAESGKGKSLDLVRHERSSKDAPKVKKFLLDQTTSPREKAAIRESFLGSLTAPHARAIKTE